MKEALHEDGMKREQDERGYDAIDPKNKSRAEDIEFRLRDGRLFFMPLNERGPMAVSPDQTAMTILFHSGSVVLWGENLATISRAISKRAIEYVEEFDPAQRDQPSEPGRVIVQRIEIRTKQDVEDIAETPEDQPRVRLAKH